MLLPVVGELAVESWLSRLLCGGTSAVLIAETREEYVARAMSDDRKARESARVFRDFVTELTREAGGELLVALDQEPWGIQRLHDLVPPYPSPKSFTQLPLEEVRSVARGVAEAAKALGVGMFLSPVLDVLDGQNPWLEGRTLRGAVTAAEVGRIAAAFVEGTQHAGVTTVAKHFPGFPEVTVDPAVDASASVASGRWDARALEPFEAVVRAGTGAVMLGPVVVEDVDKDEPASTSRRTVDILRDELGFAGLVVSDDLDAPATLNGRTLNQTMIDSLRAGADLLLVGGGEHLHAAIDEIHDAAAADPAFAVRVIEAGRRVRKAALEFGGSG